MKPYNIEALFIYLESIGLLDEYLDCAEDYYGSLDAYIRKFQSYFPEPIELFDCAPFDSRFNNAHWEFNEMAKEWNANNGI